MKSENSEPVKVKADAVTVKADAGNEFSPPDVFDYILLDAECSHEGSLKHIQKYKSQWGLNSLE